MSDFILSREQLVTILPENKYVDQWYDALERCLPEYDINTRDRIAAFLAQCIHESGGFSTIHENLNYKAASLVRVWPKHFPSMAVAEQYAKQPEKIANKVYANRMGNGDESSGDGWKYRGQGLIQLTGANNYKAFADSIDISVDQAIEYIATFEGAVQSACWFWETNSLNALADQKDMIALTKKINGGTNGLEDRLNHYEHIQAIL